MFEEPVDHILERKKICSLRSAGNFLKKNEVLADGIPVKERNFRLEPGKSKLFINGSEIPLEKHLYFMLNKPAGFVCSRVSDSHKTVYQLLPEEIKNHPDYSHLHTVGRLDAETEGVLLFTTNGVFSNYLTKAENHVPKTYEAVLKFNVSEKSEQEKLIQQFKNGIYCEPEKKGEAFKSLPSELEFIEENRCLLTIHEGKFHQVRRMFSSVKNEVVKLTRISFGNLRIESFHENGGIIHLEPENVWNFR